MTTAIRCHNCKNSIAPSHQLFIRKNRERNGSVGRYRARPFCWKCAGVQHGVWRAVPCAGCGRKMRLTRDIHSTVCSAHCANVVQAAQRKARRHAQRVPITCPGCGRPFIPVRSDAVTCSPTCRQRLHRRA